MLNKKLVHREIAEKASIIVAKYRSKFMKVPFRSIYENTRCLKYSGHKLRKVMSKIRVSMYIIEL